MTPSRETFNLSKDQDSEFVYDFLYHDTVRVGSFLSQFDKAGLLQQVKKTDSDGKLHFNKIGFSGSKGIPLLAQGTASYDGSRTTDKKEGMEKIYDPIWINATTLLDFLNAHGMIDYNLEAANIGHFALISGNLNILDLPFLKNIWDIPAVRKDILNKCYPELNENQNKPQNKNTLVKVISTTGKPESIKKSKKI